MSMQARTIVFDVNETLLDLSPLESRFAEWFGDRQVMREWFAQLVLYSQSLTLAGRYVGFGTIAGAMLDIVARIRARDLPPEAKTQLKEAIGQLPAHAGVAPGLARLRDASFRLVTLTNSDAETQRRQLDHTGISDLFEAQFSVEAVQAFKPATNTYAHVADALNVSGATMTMVACHAWDIVGARAAGCATGFIRRSGNSQPELPDMRATYEAETLVGLADILIAASTDTASRRS